VTPRSLFTSSEGFLAEWWYFSVLVISVALGAAGVGAFPTMTTPAVVLYGLFLALIL